MVIVAFDAVVARRTVRRLGQPLDAASRALTVLVEPRLFIDERLVFLSVLRVLSHSTAFERIQRELVIFKVHHESPSFSHVSLLLGKEGQLRLVLVSVDDARVAALDAPHEHLGKNADRKVDIAQPRPHPL